MSEFSRRLFILGMVGASVVLFVPTAWARRRRPRVRIPGPGLIEGDRHSGPILSRDKLRSCVIQQDGINANADIIERDETVLAGQAKRIEGLGDALERRRVSVDVYRQASVDAYNREVEEHRRLVSQYNARQSTHNSKLEAHNHRVNVFNAECAGQAYYESDMQAVRDELRSPGR